VRAGQTEKLSFSAVLCSDEVAGGTHETINGFSDIIICKNIPSGDNPPIQCLVELKPPIVLSIDSNIDAPKNQICAQLKGLANRNGEESLLIPKVCLTDLFSIYSSFLLEGVYYISESVYLPEDYIVLLTFQLCNMSSSEFADLVRTSTVVDDLDALTEKVEDAALDELFPSNEIDHNMDANLNTSKSGDKKKRTREHDDVDDQINQEKILNKLKAGGNTNTEISKKSRPVIDYKFMEACETYQDEVLRMIRWQDEHWGNGHLNKENLDKLSINQSENEPTKNLVLARFLNDN
jgi:hypothetical protein